MSLKNDGKDVSDEELDKIINPFYDNYHEFVVTYIMPETIAFYIASSYSWNAMFFQHYILPRICLTLTIMITTKLSEKLSNYCE